MTTTQTTQVEATSTVATVKPLAKYLAERQARRRCSFGPVWIQSVLAGTVTDQVKLVEHAVELKIGARSDMKRLKPATLLAKVQNALVPGFATLHSEPAPTAETTVA